MNVQGMTLAAPGAFTLPPNPIVEASATYGVAVIPYLPELAALAPDTKRTMWRGQDSLVIRHTEGLTRLAHNLGLPLLPPVMVSYDWHGGSPYAVQKRTVALLTLELRAYVLNSFGTGKTKSALWAFHYLRTRGLCGRMLVSAPLSTLYTTWAKEAFSTVPSLRVSVLHGTRQKRLARLEEDADIYITNHHGLRVLFAELMQRDDIDTFCVDELAVFRNGRADMTKAASALAKRMKRVWGMTGSPTPNEPTDAWSQVKMVTPWQVPDSFTNFRNQLMQKITNFKWVPKQDAQARIHTAMQPAVRFTLDDVVELPEVVYREQEVEISDLQRRAYDMLKKEMHAMFQAGELTVANSAVLMNKLLQVSLGYVYTDSRGVVNLNGEARMESIVDAIQSSDNKVIVFCPFLHALEGIHAHLTKNNIETAAVSGQTALNERNRIFSAFQGTSKYRVLLAHPVCMAHGLTLTAADTIIWAGPYTSLEVFDQANARIRRIGQRHRQQIVMMRGTAVESSVYRRLQQRQHTQNLLLDMFKGQESMI